MPLQKHSSGPELVPACSNIAAIDLQTPPQAQAKIVKMPRADVLSNEWKRPSQPPEPIPVIDIVCRYYTLSRLTADRAPGDDPTRKDAKSNHSQYDIFFSRKAPRKTAV